MLHWDVGLKNLGEHRATFNNKVTKKEFFGSRLLDFLI